MPKSMKTKIRILGLWICILTIALKVGVLITGLEYVLSAFVIGIIVWNVFPMSLLFLLLSRVTPQSLKLYVLVSGALAIAAMSLNSIGCYLMWWCEPDGQFAFWFLILPVYELIVGTSVIAFGVLLQRLAGRHKT